MADQAPASPEAVAGEESDAETTTTRKGRGRRRDRFARPEPTVPPEIPGYKEILVSTDAEELRVALVEDGRLAEIYFERPGKRSYAGNIYRGKAESVLAGMDASFIDIGLDRNGFLYVDDIADPEDGSKRPRKITQMLKAGQEIVVQVNKDPMGSKGARLTGKLSLAGRYLVYVPGGSGVGVSRRLGQERARPAARHLQVAQGQERRAHRAHGGRGQGRRRDEARPPVPLAPVDAPQEEGRHDQGARASSTRRPTCRCRWRATCSTRRSRR